MEVFEIKTHRSSYPFLVIANSIKKAINIFINKTILDESDIDSIEHLDRYKSSHIIIDNDNINSN